MPGVLTIYNCGTNYDRSNSRELIASLAAKTVGAEGQSWLLNPGPGSTELYNKSLRAQIAACLLPLGLGKPTAKFAGTLSGSGMDLNVHATLEAVRRLKPAKVNMAGWSRGAITCIEIANSIREAPDIPGIPISLFLVDPVPGPHMANFWNWSDYATKIPAIVKRCSAILQEGDTRGWLMAPLVDPFRTQTEKRSVYPMPGPHSAAVEVQKPFEPVAQMARHLVETFLAEQGTELKSITKLTPRKICELYGQMMLVLDKGDGRTSDRDKVPNAYKNSLLFVNSHHREQSSTAFPTATRLLSDLSIPSISENQKEHVTEEARAMKRDAPSAWLAFGQALRWDILRTQPVRIDLLMPPPGASLMMPGGRKLVANPPALRMTKRQEFLITLFCG